MNKSSQNDCQIELNRIFIDSIYIQYFNFLLEHVFNMLKLQRILKKSAVEQILNVPKLPVFWQWHQIWNYFFC
jgi:hypothetical protein